MMPETVAPRRRFRFSLPGRSIRVRLTLWYVSLLAIVLVGFSVGIYLFLSESVSVEVNKVTHGYQQLLTSMQPSQLPSCAKNRNCIDKPNGSGILGEIAIEYRGINPFVGPKIKIGAVQGVTANKDLTEALITWKNTGCHQSSQSHYTCTWLVYNRASRSRQPQGAVFFQTSLDSVDKAENQVLTALIVGVPLSLLLALAGGWILASRAFSPVEDIRRMAQSITATDLSQRIGSRRKDELGRLANTFDGMIDRLESAFREQRRLTADVSHELRTPLSVIQAQTTLSLKRARSPEEYTTVLASIQEETERMSRIVEDLLLLARAEAGQEVLEREAVRLDVLARWALDHVRPQAERKGVELALSVRPVMIDGDAGRIRQLALNLVDNAVKYTEPGGRVKMKVSSRKGFATLQVIDSGVGIEPRNLPHIFERFYMADRARSRTVGGLGLGLAIAQWIVAAHDGTIAVESKAGEGSTFTVRIPLHMLEREDGIATSTPQPALSTMTAPAGGAST